MTQHRKSPEHDFWHRRIEPAILETIKAHPDWFVIRVDEDRRVIVNSLAKRIVGHVVAAVRERHGEAVGKAG
jgi:hypothetical protein